jgi:hypothetical protein
MGDHTRRLSVIIAAAGQVGELSSALAGREHRRRGVDGVAAAESRVVCGDWLEWAKFGGKGSNAAHN